MLGRDPLALVRHPEADLEADLESAPKR
jgi:hypothetical protein